jgi:hypothetical protein
MVGALHGAPLGWDRIILMEQRVKKTVNDGFNTNIYSY